MSSNFDQLTPDAQALGTARDFADEFIDVLKSQRVMRHFSRPELILLSEYMDCYGVGRNATVVHDGDDGDFLAILLTGAAQIVKIRERRSTVVRDLKPGEFFGEMSMIDGERRVANCITSEPSDFAVLSPRKLNDMLADHPRLGNKFLLMLLSLTASRLRQAMHVEPPLQNTVIPWI
ncbi:MAG: cyclic nucleotide-binding domain-containing protein [Rhodoferax sp.]|jgi:CRP/FNR family cyclic AMP-dependent transcriptional regulator